MNIRWRKITVLAGDCFLFFLALLIVVTLRRPSHMSLSYLSENAAYFSGILPLWLMIFYVVGLYDLRNLNSVTVLLRDSLLSLVLNLTFSIALFYAFSISFQSLPKTHLLFTALLFHLLATFWRRFWTQIVLARVLVRKIAFWGDNPLIQRIKKDLRENNHLGFKVIPPPDLDKLISSAPPGEFWQPHNSKKPDNESELDTLIVDAEQLEAHPAMGRAVLSMAVTRKIPIFTHLDFYEELYSKIPPHNAAKPTWLFSNVLHKEDQLEAFIKRAFDIAVSLTSLLVLSPLMLVVAAISASVDRCPPFYSQKRIGYLGREFTIWKFRTMVSDAEKLGPLYKPEKKDSRITSFGHFLRRLRFDELPQLWNVLKGNMSLVGPRPEWVDEVKILEKKVPHYHLRHLVKPGITGWAQINFKATNCEQDSLEKLHYDLYYVKNISPILDLSIILKTIRRICVQDKAFGGQ